MTRFYWQLISALCILGLLSSCGVADIAPVPQPPLRVEFSNWWGDYTIIIAQENGLFEKYGMEVEPVYYEVYYNSLPDIAAGQIDCALMNLGDALTVSRHTEINVLAVYDDGGPNTVVAVPSITRVVDLKGKRVGVPLGSSYELFVTQMLEAGGLTTSDVSLFNYDPSEVPDALGIDIDAGFTWDPFTTQAEQNGNHVLFKANDEKMLFPDVIACRRDIVQNRPEEMHALLKAWFEATAFRMQNPQAARQIIANHLQVRLEEIELFSPVNLLDMQENLTLYAPGRNRTASPLQEIASINTNFLVRIGTLTERPDFAALLDGSFLR